MREWKVRKPMHHQTMPASVLNQEVSHCLPELDATTTLVAPGLQCHELLFGHAGFKRISIAL